MKGGRIKVFGEKLHDLQSSPNVIRNIMFRTADGGGMWRLWESWENV